jgi:transposase-like protein
MKSSEDLPTNRSSLIIYSDVKIKHLIERGKRYPWKKPSYCPRCQSTRLWGHGYIERYFDESDFPVWLRRYRCPVCRAVHTMRPVSHFRRFQSSAQEIIRSLWNKLSNNIWEQRQSRQRQQYWYRGFKKQIEYSRELWSSRVLAFKGLIQNRIILSTHSLKYREIPLMAHNPYRLLALPP